MKNRYKVRNFITYILIGMPRWLQLAVVGAFCVSIMLLNREGKSAVELSVYFTPIIMMLSYYFFKGRFVEKCEDCDKQNNL